MEHVRQGDLVILRLDRGEEVVGGILAALKAHGAKGAVVLTGLGALEDVEFAYYDPVHKAYDRKVLLASHELLALSGIIGRAPDGAFQAHFHVTLGAPDHGAVGGHLFSAKVSVLAEFALRVVDLAVMRREKEGEFGLMALRLHEGPSGA